MRRAPKTHHLPQNKHLGLAGTLAMTGLVFAVSVAMAPAAHAALSDPRGAAGQWDITLADSNRSCRMTFKSGPSDTINAVNMPAGCRRSLPILANVNTYEVPKEDHIALADQTGQAVLDFANDGHLSFTANGPQGEIYHLVAISGAFVQSEQSASTTPKTPGFQVAETKTAATAAVPSRIAASVKPSDLAGRYAVLRDGTRDTGCMITLDDRARSPSGGFRAALAPACRDQGIVIFDPIGWQLMAGRIVLTARKGHTTHLDLQPDNTWAKDPKEGKGLSLKKL